MSNPHFTYAPHAGATPEEELRELASVYRLVVLDCRTNEGSQPGAPDDTERRSDEIDATASTQRTA